MLATRQATPTTRAAVVTTLHARRRQLTGARHVRRTEGLTQATAQEFSAFSTAAQASDLAPATMQTTVGLLAGCLASRREEGQMTPHSVRRRRYRRLTPIVLPTPMPDADLTACFQLRNAVRDRWLFLGIVRGG